MEKNKEIQLLLNELIEKSLKIERLKSYFARNIFGEARNDMKEYSFKMKMKYKYKRFSWNERKFLFVFFDNLHNIPEYTEKMLYLVNKKDENKFFFNLFLQEMTNLYGLIDIPQGYSRFNWGIHDTGKINIWIHELQKLQELIRDSVKIIFKLEELGYIEKNKTDVACEVIEQEMKK